MSFNVFVPGITEAQLGMLDESAESCDVVFHPLLSFDRLVVAEEINMRQLLHDAREQLSAFDGRIDAIIPHWDFPTSVLVPILAADLGLRAPTLDSVLRCEHKYWSRVEQRDCIPQVVPAFDLVDPFDDLAEQKISLAYPFWLKPVKSHSSTLGFRINDAESFKEALALVRDKIGDIADAFDEVLDTVDFPSHIRRASSTMCVAEELLVGHEFALEGYATQGEVVIYGVLDIDLDEQTHSLTSLIYPASNTPARVEEEAVDATRQFLSHIGFSDGCFNAEFIWDREHDRLRLIEVNTRISQAHTDLFLKVDGAPNHLTALNVALGRQPNFPFRKGDFSVAGMYYLTTTKEGVVRTVPSQADIDSLRKEFPQTRVNLAVKPGDVLCEMAHQDQYRYRLADLWIGAQSVEQLQEVYEKCVTHLRCEIDDPSEQEETNGTHCEVSVCN
ncbi:ATP-grasp domain-containing protein [Hoyosella rhizosphaerae]|uniref:ATP-grasp domain-containing protein n=1 Tax=Hoyosella rhizosphaerae TaxID=1755582 RepID=A0A916X8V7_9ACTN|nr:ATP-grasp domain-containing protein [Hoyosella rhizosphaerae]MBN4926936.1 ATP-grasp domain-containing protein [Hoyosella rhizosphaerae]GGC55354.1 hypothetical protein GCM10011410_04670 [Hoyosella rhizosphaerae]